jgi:hypothetical protein
LPKVFFASPTLFFSRIVNTGATLELADPGIESDTFACRGGSYAVGPAEALGARHPGTVERTMPGMQGEREGSAPELNFYLHWILLAWLACGGLRREDVLFL